MPMLLSILCLFALPQVPATPAAPTSPAISAPATSTPPQDRPRILWQRSLDDALRVQEATGKPLLVCVNQDGETFCERFADSTYLDPEFVALTEKFVCVIASPDEHTKRDYDGRGRRVLRGRLCDRRPLRTRCGRRAARRHAAVRHRRVCR